MLNAGGTPILTWLNQPNSGSFTLPPFSSIGQYQVRLLSRDPLTTGADTSVPLNVWEVTESSVQDVVSYSCNEPSIRFDISWDTSILTDGVDVVEIYTPDQTCGVSTPSTASHASYGTHHEVTWYGQCQISASNPWKYVVKSTQGIGTAKSSCKTRLVTQCASCPPPCHQCEYD